MSEQEKVKQITIYIVVNKEKKLRMFVEEPKRVGDVWVGKPFVSSTIYNQLVPVIEKAGMTFESNPEIIQFKVPI